MEVEALFPERRLLQSLVLSCLFAAFDACHEQLITVAMAHRVVFRWPDTGTTVARHGYVCSMSFCSPLSRPPLNHHQILFAFRIHAGL